ncbi:MAG: NAD-dependent epimerase/dehydratase family protein, partial [Gammaproteobacteria bacterium]|nr:NAD-dependent epimerase/dehydratase family protein [Gammaproteobacteria bacterium]
MKRRDFLGLSLASSCAALSSCVVPVAPAKKKSQILVLGGTNFVGPAIVEHALAHGHEVTLFNRGITRSHLFPGIEKLRGLRAVNGGDLSALQNNRKWDAVIDVWPEESGLVEQTARLLSERTDYYFFVSSIAVYRDFSKAGLTENSPVHENDPGWYGGEKVLAEKMLERYFPGRFGVARCHAIIGPRDDGNAYHYWLRRIAGNTQVLAPGSGKDPVQYSDVRDIASWIIECVEQSRSGIYNVVGQMPPMTIRDFLVSTKKA